MGETNLGGNWVLFWWEQEQEQHLVPMFMASGPINSRQIDGETMETVSDFLSRMDEGLRILLLTPINHLLLSPACEYLHYTFGYSSG